MKLVALYWNLQNIQNGLHGKEFQPVLNPYYLARSHRFQQPKNL